MTDPATPPVDDALLAAAKRVLAKLEHETASVTIDDQLALSRAAALLSRIPSEEATEIDEVAFQKSIRDYSDAVGYPMNTGEIAALRIAITTYRITRSPRAKT